MNSHKFLESNLFRISYVSEPDETFQALRTFNKDKLYQIIDVNFSITEIIFTDIRMLHIIADHYPIRVLDKEKDKYVVNITIGKKIHYFIIENAKIFSEIVIAIAHCYSFLMQNGMLPNTVSSKSITQVVTDVDDNIIVFLDDDFFGKDEEKPEHQEPEIKIPILMSNPDKQILN